MNGAENQINDLEHKEGKRKKNNQNNGRKKNPKNQGYCKQTLSQLQAFQHSHYSGAIMRRENARTWKSI